MLNDYTPVLILLMVAVGFAVVNIGLSVLLGKRGTTNPAKETAYECGVAAEGSPKVRFSVKFYLVAVLFILFDIEAVFLFPWAVKARELGAFGFVEMLIFLVVLFVGWAYMVKKGALSWRRT